ncbi:hypothetical protein CEXT_335101 [Caerostris extrusa]|uniref:Uncharacterized protein n=1 Tax=Caerostris extrusa TaxID=172846 RepID=A0AAV4P2P5_CAEEX|nr:hypothetical protein CEXT_335101 [Caerostris extrusa]
MSETLEGAGFFFFSPLATVRKKRKEEQCVNFRPAPESTVAFSGDIFKECVQRRRTERRANKRHCSANDKVGVAKPTIGELVVDGEKKELSRCRSARRDMGPEESARFRLIA